MVQANVIAWAGATVPAFPSLVRWGVSAQADLVYRALVHGGPQSSHQVVRELGISDLRARRALDELASLGAVRSCGPLRDRRWAAADVDRTLAILRHRRRPPAIADRSRRHLAVVAGLDIQRIPADAVRRLPTRIAARRRIAELVAAERHEHLAINTEEVISPDAAKAALPLDQAMLARGIRLRILGLPPADGDRACGYAQALSGLGGDYRELTELPLKLMVFDRRTALFPADPTDFEAGAIEVGDADAVMRLTRLFYAIWPTAGDPRRQGVPSIVLTMREQAIVTLLAAGVTEEAAAAELGLSRRTVVYTLRALMDRLGVENRFQLALLLGAARAVPLPTSHTRHPTDEGNP